MNGRITIDRQASPEQFLSAATHAFTDAAVQAIARRGRFMVALSGGSTPRAVFEKLAEYHQRVGDTLFDWRKVHVFWGDERPVGPDHPESNYRMARETLLDKVALPAENIHRMRGESADLDVSAREYQEDIARTFGVASDGPPPQFDLIFLGMGPDGHTASLFPHTSALAERQRWVVANDVPQLKTRRLTLTLPVLNRARQIVFLVTGADKAERLADVLRGPRRPKGLPSQLIDPIAGELRWVVDEAAVSRLWDSTVRIAPSILAADFAHLGEQVEEARAAGADRIHVDVMDGHFVPNISMGPVVVRALRKVTPLPLEVHLMIEEPDRYLEEFAEAGADSLIVHVEGNANLHRTIQRIRSLGKKAGVAINPATPAPSIGEILGDLDLVLVMTVNPGFGGQQFLAEVLPKIREVRDLLDCRRPWCELEVDGGIDATTAAAVTLAGANILVAGSAIFGAPAGIAAAMASLRSISPV